MLTLSSDSINSGTVSFYASVTNADIHLYGGTLALYGASATSTNVDKSQIENIKYFSTSDLTVEFPANLRTRNLDAPDPSDYAHLSLEEAMKKIKTEFTKYAEHTVIQSVSLGKILTLKNNLFVQPAVDLVNAVSDTYSTDSAVSTGGKIVVTGWIVKADETDKTSVTVSLTSDTSGELGKYFVLSGSATVAYGPVFVWDVVHSEGSSKFTFVKSHVETIKVLTEGGGEEDVVIHAEVVDEGTTENNTEPNEKIPEGGNSGDEIAYTLNTTEEDDDQQQEPSVVVRTQYTDTPTNYNPDVYGEQVAVLGISVIQNAISETVFSEMRVGRLAHLLSDERPARKEWWGKVGGADLDLQTKNFYHVDVKYALGMIGHQFEPIDTRIGSFEFGAYVGGVTGTEKYSISKVKQNGGFVGGSVLYEAGNTWLAAHANVGLMSNHLRGITDNQTDNPWVGIGMSTGYIFNFPAPKLIVAPLINISYVAIKAKDYTTNFETNVHNASLHSFEFSPGVRLEKILGQGWLVHGQGRYAVVTKHDGKTKAIYKDKEMFSIPCITNKNYAEYGVGVQKQTKHWSVEMNVNRSDGGRTGWSGMARVSYQF